MRHVNPETAGQSEKASGDYDGKGRYRGTGRARNAAKATPETERRFQRYAEKVNAPG